MKNKGYIFTLAAVALALGACSKDNDTPLTPISDKSYSGVTALDLEYDDAPMSGKTVDYTQNGTDAVLTMRSVVSPGDLSASLKALPSIPGPGVLPGSPTLRLPVTLHADGDEYEFSGTGETEFVTYSYSGDVNANKLDFDFDNVRLKNQRLANTAWVPAPTIAADGGIGYKSLPVHIVWECSLPIQLEGFDGTIQDALTILACLPIIPAYNNTAYMSLTQVLGSALKTVAFRSDGNAVVTYLQSNNGAAQFAQAPICMIQYLPLNDNILKLFVNPTDFMGQILINTSSHPNLPANPFGKAKRSGETPATATGQVSIEQMAKILEQMAPMISEGFPMQYSMTKSSLQIFLNTETLLPLLKGVIVPLLSDPIIQESMFEAVATNPMFAHQLPVVKKLLAAFPQLLDSTTKIELGINLVPYAK